MTYKYFRAIDACGFYLESVLFFEENLVSEEGNSVCEFVPQWYNLPEGGQFIDGELPSYRTESNSAGFVRPQWDGEVWVEGATAQEIEAWVLDNPSSVADGVPTEMEQLRADVDFLALMGGVSL